MESALIKAKPSGLKVGEKLAEKKKLGILWFQSLARRCSSKRQNKQRTD